LAPLAGCFCCLAGTTGAAFLAGTTGAAFFTGAPFFTGALF